MATTDRIATQSVELMNNVTPMELWSVSVAGKVPTLAVTHVSPHVVSSRPFRWSDLYPWLGDKLENCFMDDFIVIGKHLTKHGKVFTADESLTNAVY